MGVPINTSDTCDRLSELWLIRAVDKATLYLRGIKLHVWMALFAIVWGTAAFLTRTFSAAEAQQLINQLAPDSFIGGFIFLSGVTHLIAYRLRWVWLYITTLMFQCLFWWCIGLMFILAGVISAGLLVYPFISLAATMNLINLSEGMK